MGIKDPRKKYQIEDMVKATACSPRPASPTGDLLKGVRFNRDVIHTETVVMRSVTGTVRWTSAEHRQLDKFHLD